jgi:peptide/nickel transport system substrate-binding protein
VSPRWGLVLLAAAVVTACSSKAGSSKSGVALQYPRGGVVKVGLVELRLGESGPGEPELDPSREYVAEAFELFRCCLLRTLYQYSGQPTSEGGAQLRPDLATAPPELSADGLTWTVHLRRGMHYAPPLQDQEIVAQDFVTALKRTAKVTKEDFTYAAYYSIIQGFDAYASGMADAISGIATPDSHTLVFTLTVPAGDFADRLALAASAPIPTVASSPGVFGVATGHDNGYGHYLVASGPYMLEGSSALTPGAPVGRQKPAAGFLPEARALRLVRNPSWDPTTDDLRPAYPDRIEVRIFPTVGDARAGLDRGTVDVVMYGGRLGEVDRDQYRRYQADPSLGRALVHPRGATRWASMNLAQPPFDDVHLRKAANYVVDKKAYINMIGGPVAGSPATHVIPDSLEQNQLVSYDPYRAGSPEEALVLAKREMRQSKYDHDGDGVCDAAVCRHVDALAFPSDDGNAIKADRSLAHDLALIGIQVDLEPVDGKTFFERVQDPTARVPLGLAPAWAHDFLNASNFMTPLFAGPDVSPKFTVPGLTRGQCCNFSLVGASPASLRGWGYPVTHVPSADARINHCLRLVGRSQTQCWTALDQYLTQVVVPWIPLYNENTLTIVPARVVSVSLDEFTAEPSLDRVVMKAAASPSSTPH